MIDVEYRRSAAWAQLACHYGIAVMTHYRACRPPDLTGEVAPVPFLPRLRIETMSRNKGSVWVKFITPEVGVRIRIPPARPGGPNNLSTVLLCCHVSAGTFQIYFSLCFCIRVTIFDFFLAGILWSVCFELNQDFVLFCSLLLRRNIDRLQHPIPSLRPWTRGGREAWDRWSSHSICLWFYILCLLSLSDHPPSLCDLMEASFRTEEKVSHYACQFLITFISTLESLVDGPKNTQ